MSVTVEMWVRGKRERIDTALWQLEEAVTGAVRITDKWLGDPDDQGLVDGWFSVELSNLEETSAGCEAVRTALATIDGREDLLFGGPCFPETEAPERP